jgi:hypothetical protein
VSPVAGPAIMAALGGQRQAGGRSASSTQQRAPPRRTLCRGAKLSTSVLDRARHGGLRGRSFGGVARGRPLRTSSRQERPPFTLHLAGTTITEALVPAAAVPPGTCAMRAHAGAPSAPHPQPAGESYDVVLSSGFLAFANHSGFLQAVEEVGGDVGVGSELRRRRRWGLASEPTLPAALPTPSLPRAPRRAVGHPRGRRDGHQRGRAGRQPVLGRVLAARGAPTCRRATRPRGRLARSRPSPRRARRRARCSGVGARSSPQASLRIPAGHTQRRPSRPARRAPRPSLLVLPVSHLTLCFIPPNPGLTHTHTHARTHTRIHTHAHTRMHAHMRTHMHTHVHAHPAPALGRSRATCPSRHPSSCSSPAGSLGAAACCPSTPSSRASRSCCRRRLRTWNGTLPSASSPATAGTCSSTLARCPRRSRRRRRSPSCSARWTCPVRPRRTPGRRDCHASTCGRCHGSRERRDGQRPG